jgi:hypothetical protein
MENFERKDMGVEERKIEKYYNKKGLDYLNSSQEIEEIIYPEEKYFEIKDIETEDEAEKTFFNELKNNLQAPIIKDSFEDHNKRREWRNELNKENPEAYDIYERNKIRLNKISTNIGICQYFEDRLNQSQKEKLDDIVNKTNKIKESYNDLSFEDKKKMAKEINYFIYDVYQSLSN